LLRFNLLTKRFFVYFNFPKTLDLKKKYFGVNENEHFLRCRKKKFFSTKRYNFHNFILSILFLSQEYQRYANLKGLFFRTKFSPEKELFF